MGGEGAAVTRKQDRRDITRGQFRRKRFFLADHVFAVAGGPDHEPQDLLSKKGWDRLMDLPTDVAGGELVLVNRKCLQAGTGYRKVPG